MSLRQGSVTYVKSFLRAFTREKRYPTCFKFRFVSSPPFGTTPEEAGPVDPPPRLPEAKEVIESKIIPCERCGIVVAMLIFAPNATDPGRFEDFPHRHQYLLWGDNH
jgi:hypothetical protein